MKLTSRLQVITESVTMNRVLKIISKFKFLGAAYTSSGWFDLRISSYPEFTLLSFFVDDNTGVVSFRFPCYLYSQKETNMLYSLLKSYSSVSKLDTDKNKVAVKSLVWFVKFMPGVLLEDVIEVISSIIARKTRELRAAIRLGQVLSKETTEHLKHNDDLFDKYHPYRGNLIIPSPRLQRLSPNVAIYSKTFNASCCNYLAVPAQPTSNSGYIRTYFGLSAGTNSAGRLFYNATDLELKHVEAALRKTFSFVSRVYTLTRFNLVRTFGKSNCTYLYSDSVYYVIDFSEEISPRSVVDVHTYLMLPKDARDKYTRSNTG